MMKEKQRLHNSNARALWAGVVLLARGVGCSLGFLLRRQGVIFEGLRFGQEAQGLDDLRVP